MTETRSSNTRFRLCIDPSSTASFTTPNHDFTLTDWANRTLNVKGRGVTADPAGISTNGYTVEPLAKL